MLSFLHWLYETCTKHKHAGYFCLNGTSTPEKCKYPYYCPAGTSEPLNCDVGYQPLNISDSGIRDTLERSCMQCPAGSFRNSSDESKCLPCPPGFYCPPGLLLDMIKCCFEIYFESVPAGIQFFNIKTKFC